MTLKYLIFLLKNVIIIIDIIDTYKFMTIFNSFLLMTPMKPADPVTNIFLSFIFILEAEAGIEPA